MVELFSGSREELSSRWNWGCENISQDLKVPSGSRGMLMSRTSSMLRFTNASWCGIAQWWEGVAARKLCSKKCMGRLILGRQRMNKIKIWNLPKPPISGKRSSNCIFSVEFAISEQLCIKEHQHESGLCPWSSAFRGFHTAISLDFETLLKVCQKSQWNSPFGLEPKKLSFVHTTYPFQVNPAQAAFSFQSPFLRLRYFRGRSTLGKEGCGKTSVKALLFLVWGYHAASQARQQTLSHMLVRSGDQYDSQRNECAVPDRVMGTAVTIALALHHGSSTACFRSSILEEWVFNVNFYSSYALNQENELFIHPEPPQNKNRWCIWEAERQLVIKGV